MIDLIKNQILESIEVKKNLLDTSLSDIELAVSLMITSIRNKGKILWCGNGGSAADASAALPPFPHHNIFPLFLIEVIIRLTASSISDKEVSKRFFFTSILSSI